MATKKDYVLVAKALNEAYKCATEHGAFEGDTVMNDLGVEYPSGEAMLQMVEDFLCIAFRENSDKFDEDKFRTAIYKQ